LICLVISFTAIIIFLKYEKRRKKLSYLFFKKGKAKKLELSAGVTSNKKHLSLLAKKKKKLSYLFFKKGKKEFFFS